MPTPTTPAVRRSRTRKPAAGPDMVPADVEVTPIPKAPRKRTTKAAAQKALREGIVEALAVSDAAAAALIGSGLDDLLVDDAAAVQAAGASVGVTIPDHDAAAIADMFPAPSGHDVIDGPPASGPSPEAVAADLPDPAPVVEDDPLAWIAAAKAEKKAQDVAYAARKRGEDVPMPATPNLDAGNPSQRKPVKPAKRVRADGQAPRSRASITGIYRDAVDRKRQGPRGPGIKVTDAEDHDALVKLNAEHPGLTGAQAQEVAHWILGLAVSKGRTLRAWEDVTA